MPLTNWGALDANRYQQQRSQGRGWGNQSYRGYPRQQPGGYQQPPMPYAGAGAWQQPTQNRAQWSQQPQRGYRAGGGIGGTVGTGGRRGMPGLSTPTDRLFHELKTMGLESGLSPSAMDYISNLDIGGRQGLMQQMGYVPRQEGDIREWLFMKGLGLTGGSNNYMANPWMGNY